MPLWRCLNERCEGGDFEGAEPECPACRGRLAQALLPVHYLVPAEGPIRTGIGNRMVACDPGLATLPPAASGKRKAVTCPACRASAIFAEDERDGVSNHVPVLEARVADRERRARGCPR